MLYLDHAATTPMRREVAEAMLGVWQGAFGNPSSTHEIGEAARGVYEDARARVAAVLGVSPADIVFTSGGTEANNLAITGVALAARERRGAKHLVSSPLEHSSVLASLDYLRRVHGFEVDMARVSATGLVDPASVAEAIRPDTALVSIGYANNEVGTVQDPAALRDATGSVPLHLDAVQAAGWLPLRGLGADALSLAGHKIGAARGTGVLMLRSRIPVEPVIHGGGQQDGRRSGTEDVAGAVGFATALELAEAEREEAAARIAGIRNELVSRVLRDVPGAMLTGDPDRRLPGIASFTFADVNGEAVLLELERRGVVCSSGSACSAGSTEPSHVLLAMGIPEHLAYTAVRLSLSPRSQLDPAAVARTIAEAVAAVRG